jgi:TldD protein
LTPKALPCYLFLFCVASAVSAETPVLLDAMSQELNRNFTVLKEKADPPPYYLSYEVTEQEYRSISGTLGAIDSSGGGKTRTLDVSVRVGTSKLDN